MKKTIIAAFLMFSGSCYAMTGNELYSLMQNDPAGAIRYVQAVVDFNSFILDRDQLFSEHDKTPFHSDRYVCLPKGGSFQQVHDLIFNFIKEHPELRHENAATISVAAMMKEWRCK